MDQVIDKFRETFKEEAYERLAELEASLLELEERPDDKAQIERVFRSLHTIKGSGAMFGFDDIAAFTHEMETLYDLVRKGEISVTGELVSLSLSAGDHIKTMLDNENNGGQGTGCTIIKSMKKMFPDVEKNLEINYSAGSTSEQMDTVYRLRFYPSVNIFNNGTNPIPLLNALRELGDCYVTARTGEIPQLENYIPEGCYTSWDIILRTRQGADAVRDVFMFIEDQCELYIDVIDKTEHSGKDSFKKICDYLSESGDLTNEQLMAVLEKQKQIMKLPQTGKETGHNNYQKISAEKAIKVAPDKLNTLVDLVGEMVTLQARLARKASLLDEPELISIAEDAQRLIASLRDNTMSIRMMPVGTLFNKFKRLIHDLSRELNKEAVMEIRGGETELDKILIDRLNDPLIHIIRNTIDHGIEAPEIREAAGKARQGKVCLCAEHAGGSVLIRISGDGAGIDIESIHARAVEKGLISPDTQLSDKEIISLIFIPGFTTAKKISCVSGRGVGMDVVKQTIESLGGTIDIISKKGMGTTTILKLPLTLAIIDGLQVKVGDEDYILPLSAVEECIKLTAQAAETAETRNMLDLRKKVVPYLSLRKMLMVQGEGPEMRRAAILNVKNGKIALEVDAVIGQHQTVVKSLGQSYKYSDAISGATILGNGSLALIINVNRLAGVI